MYESNQRLASRPIHRLGSDGVYMVTGATLYKQHLFDGPERLNMLEGRLLTLAKVLAGSSKLLRFQTTAISLAEAIDTQRTLVCF